MSSIYPGIHFLYMNKVVSTEKFAFYISFFLYFLPVVDNTFMTSWRTHLPVHVPLQLELCCFSFELILPHGFISKEAALLIITEWPTSMSSLISLTFHFPTCHEPKRAILFLFPPSLFMYLLSTSKGMFLFHSSHSTLTWTRFFLSSLLDQQLWSLKKQHVPNVL
jgi:hypothetical protein